MIKHAFVLAFLCLLLAPAFAAITDYTVPANLPLNKFLTIYGVHDTGNVLCSFYIFDVEDQNQAIIRLTDEYSTESGRFYAEIQVTEPLFRRGIDYNAVTVCGSVVAHQIFYVDQKEDFIFGVSPEMVRNDFAWWTKSENSVTMVLILIAIFIVAAIAYMVFIDLSGPNIWTGRAGR